MGDNHLEALEREMAELKDSLRELNDSLEPLRDEVVQPTNAKQNASTMIKLSKVRDAWQWNAFNTAIIAALLFAIHVGCKSRATPPG